MFNSSINGMAERLRARLQGTEGIVLPGCHDVLSAILLETAGFDQVFLSGYGVAASLLGNPDIGLTTLSETAMIAKHVVSRLNVPVFVDIDNGYGNEESVTRTIHEMEHAGVAAIVLEDQVMPKRCGHSAHKEVLPLDIYLKKLDHALHTRRTPMVVVARTDATNIDEAISRAQAFHAAGADITLVDGIASLDNARRVSAEVPGPKQLNLIYGGKTPILPTDEFFAMGFKIVVYSTPTLFVTAEALQKQMHILHETRDLNAVATFSQSFHEFQHFIQKHYAHTLRSSVPDVRRAIPDVRQAVPEVRQAVPEVRQAVPEVVMSH